MGAAGDAPPPPGAGAWDVVVVGAGAAGLMTALLTAERAPSARVLLLEGARKTGAKILVSGGSRCNVTNARVSERDYRGGSSAIVRQVLRAFPVHATIAFFREAGVPLHEESHGKLFPDSNRSRDVLEALLARAGRAGVVLRESSRVTGVTQRERGFVVEIAGGGAVGAGCVVLAAGGQALPKSGSDGSGYALARSFGHSIVPTTPALVPLLLDDGAGALHQDLQGVSLDVELTLWIGGAAALRQRGSLLWTHFGVSGPVVLDMSRHWLRAALEGRQPALTASFLPGTPFEAAEALWHLEARDRPRGTVQTALARLVPASAAAALLGAAAVDPCTPVSTFDRAARRRLTHALTAYRLPVTGSRGYTYAEATAGGVDLREIRPASMESRRCPGLYLVGEILDVDGRLGGFNFQWAWSSAYVAASAVARRQALRDDG